MAVLCGRTGWLVLECKRTSRGRDSVDADCARSFGVLENQRNQSVSIKYQRSLVGIAPRNALFCRRLSGFLQGNRSEKLSGLVLRDLGTKC